MTTRNEFVTGIGAFGLGMVAAGVLVIAIDRAPQPTATAPVVQQPPWADGCTTDADCARWNVGTGSDPADLPTLPDSCDVTFEGDEEHLYPCVDHPVESITGPDGEVHNACAVILTSDEDSLAVCADGTEWPS